MYADYLVHMAPSPIGLSMLLSVCTEYVIKHDIKYNSAEINIMIFCCKGVKYIYILDFVLRGEILPGVNNCKYVGQIITENLADNDDISRQCKIIYALGIKY